MTDNRTEDQLSAKGRGNGSQQAFCDEFNDGLSKRELFAAMAMSPLLTCNPQAGFDDIARDCVRMADELLRALING